MNERDFDETPKGNRPLETLRDGALKLSIFRNQNEHGESYALVPRRIYTDKESGKVRETSSLAGGEALRMAHLLTRGYERVGHYREQDKEVAKDKEKNARSRREREDHER